MPHLSELHGAATHLAVVAIPLFAVLHFLRRAGRGGAAVAGAEPWALGAALVGIAAAGVTGLLVWGQAQTTLRGQHFRVGDVHFWLGIAVAVLAVAAAGDWYRARRRDGPTHRPKVVPLLAVLIVAGVVVQGYLGGRMTYDDGVGVYDGGQLAQTAAGVAQLDVALSKGTDQRYDRRARWPSPRRAWVAPRRHGDLAEGLRAPPLAGGREVADFRRVHAHGLFPARSSAIGTSPRSTPGCGRCSPPPWAAPRESWCGRLAAAGAVGIRSAADRAQQEVVEPAALLEVEAARTSSSTAASANSAFASWRSARVGELDGVAAAVLGRAPALDQPALLELVEQPDEVRAVDPQRRGERLLVLPPWSRRSVSATRCRGRSPSGASTASARTRIRRARWSSSAAERGRAGR